MRGLTSLSHTKKKLKLGNRKLIKYCCQNDFIPTLFFRSNFVMIVEKMLADSCSNPEKNSQLCGAPNILIKIYAKWGKLATPRASAIRIIDVRGRAFLLTLVSSRFYESTSWGLFVERRVKILGYLFRFISEKNASFCLILVVLEFWQFVRFCANFYQYFRIFAIVCDWVWLCVIEI